MKTTLKNIDSLDIDFVCRAIEKSLRITYKEDELTNVSNLGELCDVTVAKIVTENSESCTNQEAFYKIRNTFCEIHNLPKNKIEPNTEISTVLMRKHRIKNVRKIEKRLGFRLDLLSAPGWIIGVLIFILAAGIIFLFIKTFIGICLIIFALLGFEFCKDYGKELKINTFIELTENTVLNNYRKLRRHNDTVNKNEIEKVIIGLFTKLLDFPANELTRETTF